MPRIVPTDWKTLLKVFENFGCSYERKVLRSVTVCPARAGSRLDFAEQRVAHAAEQALDLAARRRVARRRVNLGDTADASGYRPRPPRMGAGASGGRQRRFHPCDRVPGEVSGAVENAAGEPCGRLADADILAVPRQAWTMALFSATRWRSVGEG